MYPLCVRPSLLAWSRLTSVVAANGANFGYNTAWLFFALGLMASILAIFIIPETAKRSPAELDELYEKRIPAWKMKGYVTDVQKAQNGTE